MSTSDGLKSAKELRKLGETKLHEEHTGLEKKLFKISFEVSSGQSKRNDLVDKYKKQVARIQTILNEMKSAKSQEATTN